MDSFCVLYTFIVCTLKTVPSIFTALITILTLLCVCFLPSFQGCWVAASPLFTRSCKIYLTALIYDTASELSACGQKSMFECVWERMCECGCVGMPGSQEDHHCCAQCSGTQPGTQVGKRVNNSHVHTNTRIHL